jgi:HEAT repeat protein
MHVSTTSFFLLLLLSITFGCELYSTKTDSNPDQPKPSSPTNNEWDKKINATEFSATSDAVNASLLDSTALEGPSAAPKIAPYLEDPSVKVREKASTLLVGFGNSAEGAIGRILKTLRSTDPKLRLIAAKTLAQIGSPTGRDGLKGALEDPASVVVAWAHAGLAKLGADCGNHLEELAAILRKAQGQAAMEVAHAMDIVACQRKDALETICEALQKGDAALAAAACHALGHLRASSVPCVKALSEALSNKDFQVRREAVLAVASLGEQGVPAVEQLIKMLSDPAPRFRELAAFALGSIGPKASAAIGPLQKATVDQEAPVQAAAKRALASIQQLGP